MKKILPIITILFIMNSTLYSGTFHGNRRDFIQGSDIIPKEGIQIDSGYSYTKKDNEIVHEIGELLIHLGVMKYTEALFGVNSYKVAEIDGEKESGKDDGYLGLKVKLMEAPVRFNLWLPDIGVVFGSMLPTGNSSITEKSLQPETTLIFSWQIPRTLLLDLNFKYSYLNKKEDSGEPSTIDNEEASFEHFNQFSSGIALAVLLSDVTFFSELYFLNPEEFQRKTIFKSCIGVILKYSNNFYIDIRFGGNLNGEKNNYVSAGAVSRWIGLY